MSLIDCKIEIGLNAFQYTGGNFILDSSTLGVLGTSKLSGLEWYDVSQYVQQVQVRRGRSRQLDYYQAGSTTVYFNNAERLFDPLNTASIYYPGVEPRCLIRISSRGHWLFTGFINDWDLQYDIANQDTAVAYCADAFMIMANQTLTAHTPTAQLSGARVNAVLNRSEINYRGGRTISNGLSNLGAYAVSAGTNCLNYLRQIERSEIGDFFVAADGGVIFRERAEIPDNAVVDFADDGSGIPYQSLMNQYGDELLYNYVQTQSPAGALQTNSDSESITQYQTSELSWTDLLNSSTTEVSNIGKVALNNFKEPKVRFTGFSVQILGVTDDQKDAVLGLDLTDFLTIKKSFATGSPASYTQNSVLTGISHDVRPGSHVVTFNVENSQSAIFLILGDVFAGQLDYGQLDF